jgi:hypothetical protein
VRGEKAGAEHGEDEGGNAGACYHGTFGTAGWAGEVFVLIFLRQEGKIRKAKRQKGRRGDGRGGLRERREIREAQRAGEKHKDKKKKKKDDDD